ncbi:MAG: MBL fold metallo-hydrolase, partial [Deltaproteobacteria bacterium]|nr:MBL fold metallo-hydrolase [Deltaproteobacteria bacterium]
MTDLFALSEKAINGEINDQPFNRISLKLFELTDEIAMVEAFSHSIIFKTEEGLVVFDTSNEQCGKPVVDAIRGWSTGRFNTIVYTHGHIDHVGGSSEFLADVNVHGHPEPRVIAHENILKRFDRYEVTGGYNTVINERQFGKLFSGQMTVIGKNNFLPKGTVRPNITYSD